MKNILMEVNLEIRYWLLLAVLWVGNRHAALLMWNERELLKPIAKAEARKLFETKSKEERKQIAKESIDLLLRL